MVWTWSNFFPAEASGGIEMIKSLAAPYSNIRFMPTGGIHACNLNTYLAFPKVIACGGSWMVKPEMIRSGQFNEIQRLTEEAVKTMLGFELRCVGIHSQDGTEAEQAAVYFGKIFEREHGSCRKNGHIVIGTNNVERAVSYLVSKDVMMDLSTARYKGDRLSEIYLTKEIGGLAVKLMGKTGWGIEMKRVVTFGEIMLRLAPEGYYRFAQAEKFGASYGGGGSQVAVSLACFGLDASFVSKLPEHEIGQAAVNALRRFGVDVTFIRRGGSRMGIYFLEKGASQRPSKVIYDRTGSSISEADSSDFN